MPKYADSIGPLPLTGGLFVMSPIAVQLDGVDVSPHHLRADLDLVAD